MTAEIAILNRTAVALAADSVVTLSDGRRHKTYDSAEKIFEFSRFQPIALMIYNNAQFMNAPFEIIIREYRETLTSNSFKQLVQPRDRDRQSVGDPSPWRELLAVPEWEIPLRRLKRPAPGETDSWYRCLIDYGRCLRP